MAIAIANGPSLSGSMRVGNIAVPLLNVRSAVRLTFDLRSQSTYTFALIDLSGPLTAPYPRPRLVRLAGEDYRIGEAPALDIADLQTWLDARWPDPLEGLRSRPEGMSLEDYEKALLEAYDVAEAGPPTFGTPRAGRSSSRRRRARSSILRGGPAAPSP